MRDTLAAACFVATLFGPSLVAQSAPPLRAPRIGLLGGINIASLKGSGAQGFGSRTGVAVGALFVKPIGANTSLQAEGFFAMKGATSSSSGASGGINTNFIEVPVLLRYDVPAAGDVKPFLLGGLATSFNLSCNLEATSGGTTVTMTCQEADQQFGNGTNRFQTVDLGGVFGGGLSFNVGGRTMTLGARYELGFSTISSEADTKHRVVSFQATFEWPIHR